MFEIKHKEHKIEKLENIYNSHCLLIKNESKELKNKCDKLNNYLKLLNEKIILVRNYKTERSIELEEVFEKMKNKLESLMHEKLTKLINSKNMIIDKLKFLDNIKNMIESELSEAPKSELISKSENIIKDLKEIEKEDEMRKDVLNISLDLPSDIHPPYESGSFVIKDYKLMVLQFQSQMQLQNSGGSGNNGCNGKGINFGLFGNNEVLYSEDLKTNGLIWRLKVYPFGNGAIKGEFVSVFLELRDGLIESSKYFYKIEIENLYSKINLFFFSISKFK
jgi:tripartite motif-containing protein 37